MEQGKQIRLTSGDITQLWMQYMEDSASICTLSYFLEKAEDTEVKTIIDHAQAHTQKISSILTQEKQKSLMALK